MEFRAKAVAKPLVRQWLKMVCFCAACFTATSSALADSELEQFAQTYFERWVATQAPDAKTPALEAYLDLLADDIGHTHLPWMTDDTREADGKQRMREGMTFYLGAHKEYTAELLDVLTFGDTAISVRYRYASKGIHPESGDVITREGVMMELLEMDAGKVGVIRKYDE